MFTISNRIEYLDHVFEGQAIKRGNPYYARSLTSSSLEIDSFDFEVRSSDTTLTQFVRNTPLTYYHDGVQMGIFYVQKISRTSIATYRFECTSTIGLLDESYHNGGIYTGETVKEVVEDICGPYPIWIKTNIQNIQLYGWLPIATRRENLSQVLFALGATLKVDYNGTLRVEGLWDGQSTEIDAGHMHAGGSVEYSTPVTQVIVTEHAYTANATETTELFNGTTAAGDKITFDEPCYDLVAEGFSIFESAANYAIVSAGSGTLTGKKYVHTTRQIVKDVQPVTRDLVSVSDNVVKVENATLVSLVNASAVADRLVNYYSCTERIVNKMVTQRESPGDVVSVYHPYEDAAVRGCIESSDVTVSGKLASTETILVGYTPPDIGEQEYYDTVEVVTQSGAWTVPENVTSIRVVLIGGGQGGQAGQAGQSATESAGEYNETDSVTDFTSYGQGPGLCYGGEGGLAGNGGEGGKILQANINVVEGETFQISIGRGGAGAPFGASLNSHNGGDTIFGDYSSANGSSNPQGFTDIINGITYAGTGEAGIRGGKGGGADDDSEKDDYGNIIEGIQGESVGEFLPGTDGEPNFDEDSYLIYKDPDYTHRDVYAYCRGVAFGGKGGGAAYGANGGNGKEGIASAVANQYRVAADGWGGKGGDGANAVPPAPQTKIGFGGIGGNGGGGAGSGGAGVCIRHVPKGDHQYEGTWDMDPRAGKSGIPGNGSDGGIGGQGCVLIYYRIYMPSTNGRFITKDGIPFDEKFGRMVVV